jgi:D-hydantoinase
MEVDTVIRNAKVVTTEGTYSAGIAISGEKIVAIASDQNLPKGERIIDAKGNFVIPGLVDAHMHLNYPPDDMAKNFRSETKAAAAGGCTTVINVLIEHGSGSIVEGCKKYTSAFESDGYVDLALNAFVCTMDHIQEMREALECGISSFKFLLPYKGRETLANLPGIDDGIVYLGLQQIGNLVREGFRTFARIHAESIEVFFAIEDFYRREKKEFTTYTEVRPNFIELEAMQRVITFAKASKCPLYFVHISIREGPEIVGKARLEGLRIMAETCPQYLVLNADNTDRLRSKVNPPIRHKEDNETLWQALTNGMIDVVATDHAPVTENQRGKDFWRAPVGMAGVETWLPIMITEGVNKGRITLEKLVEVCCYNPAKIYGLTPRKGMIGVGSDADIVIVDLNKRSKVDSKNLYTQAANYYNYEGWELQGWPILTMVRGNIIMEDSKVVGKAGYGRYISAKIK